MHRRWSPARTGSCSTAGQCPGTRWYSSLSSHNSCRGTCPGTLLWNWRPFQSSPQHDEEEIARRREMEGNISILLNSRGGRGKSLLYLSVGYVPVIDWSESGPFANRQSRNHSGPASNLCRPHDHNNIYGNQFQLSQGQFTVSSPLTHLG